jgi:hypothetical protein
MHRLNHWTCAYQIFQILPGKRGIAALQLGRTTPSTTVELDFGRQGL